MGLFLVVAVALVYSNTLRGPFQYDDFTDIRDNVSIRHLWPLIDVFRIPGSGFLTRPVANLTFALNYATAGFKPLHYHLTNLFIHICATLTLLGVVRRTLALPIHGQRFTKQIPALSLITAATWALHPLLTESVSYITQRYEALTCLFVLLTLYSVLRMAASASPVKWAMLAALSCLMALGSKEIAVSLPILVLLFDRTFMAGSFPEAWRRRRVLYLGLILAWACFAVLQIYAMRRTFGGFGLTMPWWRYALNQPSVILHYLRLSVWPHPLNFDYFWPVAKHWTQLLPGLISIGTLLVLSLWGLIRKSRMAFLAIFFFMILAPTSSVMPILDLAVEHRMYLPLVPVVIFFVFGIFWIFEKLHSRFGMNLSAIRMVCIVLVGSALSILATLTYLRNEDFQNPLDLWRDVVSKAPNNPRAHHNYAFTLAEAGFIDAAIREYEMSLKLAPNVPLFLCNYGTLLGQIGRPAEALKYLRLAVQLEPNNYKFILNLGVAHWQKGSIDNAITCFTAANRLDPRASMPYYALAAVLLEKNQPHKAQDLIRKALSIEPNNPRFQYQLGLVLLRLGDLPGAQTAFSAAARYDTNPGRMTADIGWAMHDNGLDRDAIQSLRQALVLIPGDTKTQVRLAWILATSPERSIRNGKEAVELAKEILRSQDQRAPELLDLLGVSLAESGQFLEAKAALSLALAQSKDQKEKWFPDIEKRLKLFEKGQPFHERPKESAVNRPSASSSSR